MARKKSDKLNLKQRYHILRQAGYSSKEAEFLRNQSDENVMKHVNKKRRSEKRETFKPKTFLKEYKKKLSAGEEIKSAIQNLFSEPTVTSTRKPKARVKAGGQKLLILWKDVTENVGREFMDNVLQDFEGNSLDSLINTATGWQGMDFGEIGQWATMLITDSQLSSAKRMYPDYEQVYFGNGTQYKKLVEKLNFMMLAIYQLVKKNMFLAEVAGNLAEINPTAANRLINDFDIIV